MKQFKLTFLLTLPMSMVGAKALAYDLRKLLFAVTMLSYLSVLANNGDTFTAQTVEGVTVTYQIINEDNKTCQVGYTYNKNQGIRRAIDKSTSGAVTIPSNVNGYTVKYIGDHAFYECSNLTSIIVPEGVISIGGSAFNSCSNAETISIPNTVNSLSESGDRLFAGCSKLKTINIPYGITSIGPLIFHGCENLESVVLPTSLTNIGTQAFSGCTKLTSIILPDKLKSIGYLAFSGCSFTSLTLPGSFTGIVGSGLGIGSISTLKEVTICEGVTTLYEVFRTCRNIEKVTCYNQTPVSAYGCWQTPENAILYVPKGCKEAYEADDCWNKFKEIVEMEPPSPNIEFADANVKAICVANWDTNGDGELSEEEAAAVTDLGSVFMSNTTITSFNEFQYFIGLTSIGEESFKGCSSLTSITIPYNVVYIGKNAFQNCSQLTVVNITDLSAWCNIYFENGNANPLYLAHHLYIDGKEVKDLVIPDGVIEIPFAAFAYCTGLTSVTIPNSVTSIGKYAFKGCI